MFDSLKNVIFKGGELLRLAILETQKAYSSNLLVSMESGNGCVCIVGLVEVAENDFVFHLIWIFGEWKIELF